MEALSSPAGGIHLTSGEGKEGQAVQEPGCCRGAVGATAPGSHPLGSAWRTTGTWGSREERQGEKARDNCL